MAASSDFLRKESLGVIPADQADSYRRFLRRVASSFLTHPIVVDNHYTRWFRRGEATAAELRQFAVQFSVFSNQFLVAQLRKMINAESLDTMRSAKEILANEIGVIFNDPGRGPGRPATARSDGSRSDASGTSRGRPLGPVFPASSAAPTTSLIPVTEEEKDREGDPELVSTRGSVDGGTFRFRAGHFEWLLRFGAPLGLGFGDMGKRRHGTASTLFFCDELIRLYGSDDPNTAAGAGFAIENWAAAGFWQELEDGLALIKRQRMPHLPLAFFTWHNRVEAQHARHTHTELETIFFAAGFDGERFVHGGCEMLSGLASFWNGLEGDRHAGAASA